jgi:hypothetical protein
MRLDHLVSGRSWGRRGFAVTSLVAAMSVTFAGVAYADNIQDGITAPGAAVTLLAGSSTGGSTTVRVVGNNSDSGDNDLGVRDEQCNWDTGESPLVLDVVTPAGVTANPDPLSITTCGVDHTVTFTASAAAVSGTATVSITSTPAGGGGYNNQVSIPITVTQPTPTNTKPTVDVTGVEDGAQYEKGSVPDATCSVTDAEDGPSSFAATLSGTLDVDELGTQTASCSYTDRGPDPLTATASKTYSIVDTSPPTISYTLDPATPDGDNGWWTDTVSLDWTVTETGSPGSLVLDGCADQTISADQMEATYSCSATSSGGSSGPVNVKVKRDGNAPSVVYTSASPATPDGDNGWYVTPVTATFTATDLFSGVAGSGTGTNVSTADGSAVTIPSTAFSDNAGNTALAGTASSPEFKIDTVDPDVPAFVDGPADGDSYYFGSVPAAPTCTSDDDTSLLKDCVVTGYTGAVGSHTLTATATDNAGNTSTETVDYTVLAWTTKGFYSPVDMPTLLNPMPMNTVKGGSTVPLKFELFAGTTELTSVSDIASFKTQKMVCYGGALEDAIEILSTGGTSLRYDATGGQFIQNWKTPTGAGTCYSATMTADDGSSITAYFKIK